MSHKFKLKQRVRLVGGLGSGGSGREVWEIVRLLPADQTGEHSYRLKAAGLERAARETELQAT